MMRIILFSLIAFVGIMSSILPKLMSDGFREKAEKKNRTGAGAGYRIFAVGLNWMTWSIGPDLAINTDGYKSLSMIKANEAVAHPDPLAGIRYDPTNGVP